MSDVSRTEPPRTIAEGKYVRLAAKGRWEYAERIGTTGAIVVVAVTSDRRLILVEQFRPAVSRNVIELPAGLVGDDGDESEDAATAARRELLEETGYRAGSMTLLTAGPPSAGLSNEVIAFYHAGDLTKVDGGGGNQGEQITVHEVPLGDVESWLIARQRDGLLVDPKTYAGLFFLTPSPRLAP